MQNKTFKRILTGVLTAALAFSSAAFSPAENLQAALVATEAAKLTSIAVAREDGTEVAKKDELEIKYPANAADANYVASETFTVSLDGKEKAVNKGFVVKAKNMTSTVDKSTGTFVLTQKKAGTPAKGKVKVITKAKGKKNKKLKVPFTVSFVEDANWKIATAIKAGLVNESIDAGESTQVTITATPEGANFGTVVYTSSDEKVATVDDKGIVTGVAEGKATITVTSVESEALTSSVEITVNPDTTKSVTLDKESASIVVGEKVTFTAAADPEESNTKLVWSSSDEKIATVEVDEAKTTATVTGVAKGTATITAKAGTKSATATITVDEAGELAITDLVASKVDTLVATFAGKVDTEDVTLSLAKGSSDTPIASVEWDEDYTVACVTTEAKLTNGVYTLTAASTSNPTLTSSKDVEIVDQYVAEIQILNDVALTGKNGAGTDNMWAYVYYDVVDQYGESMKDSVSIQWSASADKEKEDKSLGKLAFEKSDGVTAWVYGEKLYVTGVYTKTGTVAQKEVTIGAAQATDSVELVGFVKDGETEIVQSLPEEFKANEWYMLLNGFDQNGNPMDVDTTVTGKELTFTSKSPLVIEGFEDPILKVISGTEYVAAMVKPGTQVTTGGIVEINVIANKTGGQTAIEVPVGIGQVVQSFTISAPADVVADGDTGVEFPFKALDPDGNEITDFVTLAQQETFNSLQFSASSGTTLTLKEEDDGSAKLVWDDNADYTGTGVASWAKSETTDGIDRVITLTAVVVGGEGDTLSFNVSDKRRPDAIRSLTRSTMLEGDVVTFDPTDADLDVDGHTFEYIDQYGKKMDDDNGFFAATGRFTGGDLKDALVGLKVNYAGSGNTGIFNRNGAITDAVKAVDTKTQVTSKNIETGAALGAEDTYKNYIATSVSAPSFIAGNQVKTKATGESFKFTIVKWQASSDDKDNDTIADCDEWQSLGTPKTMDVTVIDVSQVKSLAIDDIGTIYVGPVAEGIATNIHTGDGVYNAGAGLTLDNAASVGVTLAGATPNDLTANGVDSDHQKEVKLSGTFGGDEVTIDPAYVKVDGQKLKSTNGTLIDTVYTEGAPNPATNSKLTFGDLYDKTSAKNVSKTASDKLVATTEILYTNEDIEEDSGAWTIPMGTPVAAILAAVEGRQYDDGFGTVFPTAYNGLDLLTNGVTPGPSYGTVNAYMADPSNVLDDAYADIMALATSVSVDSASINVSISDQAPYAAAITGVDESYTISAWDGIVGDVMTSIRATDGSDPVVEDQYGVENATWTTELAVKLNNIVENPLRYKENNFKVSGNATPLVALEKAELGDTADLEFTYKTLTATSKLVIGADGDSRIVNNRNDYLDNLIVELEK